MNAKQFLRIIDLQNNHKTNKYIIDFYTIFVNNLLVFKTLKLKIKFEMDIIYYSMKLYSVNFAQDSAIIQQNL